MRVSPTYDSYSGSVYHLGAEEAQKDERPISRFEIHPRYLYKRRRISYRYKVTLVKSRAKSPREPSGIKFEDGFTDTNKDFTRSVSAREINAGGERAHIMPPSRARAPQTIMIFRATRVIARPDNLQTAN